MLEKRFKTKEEAKLEQARLLNQGLHAHVYRGHRGYVVQWWPRNIETLVGNEIGGNKTV